MKGYSFFRTNVLVSILCCSWFLTQSQTVEKDSLFSALKTQIEKANTDSLKVQLQFNLVEKIGKTKDFRAREEAILIVKDILQTIESKELNSPYFQRLKAESLQNMATLKMDGKDLVDALEWQQKAIDYSTEIDFELVQGVGYWGLGIIQNRRKDTIKAKRNFLKSIAVLKPIDTDDARSLHAQSLIHLGNILIEQHKTDSTRLLNRQAIALDKTGYFHPGALHNIARTYRFEKKYNKALEAFQESLTYRNASDFRAKSITFQSIAIIYRESEKYKKGLVAIDSAIYYEKQALENPLPRRMKGLLDWKKLLLYKDKQYQKAYDNYTLYDKYKDTVVNIKEEKRLTELELTYEFEKEKEVTEVALKAESTKKRLYFILLFVVLILALVSIYFIIKGKKQRITLAENELKLKEMEKVKSDLALANRENELKKFVIESSITEEVLNKTLDDIKEIITFQNEKERQVALRSLSADLLSEKSTQKSSSNIKTYVDKVHMDFKIHLDTKYPQLTPKDKELIYLMKAGLSSSQISKVLNTTLAAIRSNRYRLRKKLNLPANEDIIAFLDQKGLPQR